MVVNTILLQNFVLYKFPDFADTLVTTYSVIARCHDVNPFPQIWVGWGKNNKQLSFSKQRNFMNIKNKKCTITLLQVKVLPQSTKRPSLMPTYPIYTG